MYISESRFHERILSHKVKLGNFPRFFITYSLLNFEYVIGTQLITYSLFLICQHHNGKTTVSWWTIILGDFTVKKLIFKI